MFRLRTAHGNHLRWGSPGNWPRRHHNLTWRRGGLDFKLQAQSIFWTLNRLYHSDWPLSAQLYLDTSSSHLICRRIRTQILPKMSSMHDSDGQYSSDQECTIYLSLYYISLFACLHCQCLYVTPLPQWSLLQENSMSGRDEHMTFLPSVQTYNFRGYQR